MLSLKTCAMNSARGNGRRAHLGLLGGGQRVVARKMLIDLGIVFGGVAQHQSERDPRGVSPGHEAVQTLHDIGSATPRAVDQLGLNEER